MSFVWAIDTNAQAVCMRMHAATYRRPPCLMPNQPLL